VKNPLKSNNIGEASRCKRYTTWKRTKFKTPTNSFLTVQNFLKEQQEVLILIQLNAIENNYSTRCKN
jgi:hypothetical protein